MDFLSRLFYFGGGPHPRDYLERMREEEWSTKNRHNETITRIERALEWSKIDPETKTMTLWLDDFVARNGVVHQLTPRVLQKYHYPPVVGILVSYHTRWWNQREVDDTKIVVELNM